MPFRFSAALFSALLLLYAPARAQETEQPAIDQDAAQPTNSAEAPVDQDPAEGSLPSMEAIVEAYRAGDYVTAREGLAQLAPGGTPNAKYRYGRILFEGRGGPRDLTGAARWLAEAVEESHVEAATLLARLYMNGAGVERDLGRALNLLERAAVRGDANAQYLLGDSLRRGTGVPRDADKAFNWFLAAAEQQHADAQFALSEAYATGVGTSADPEKAVFWLAEAAAGGLPEAQFHYALTLDSGTDTLPTNPQQALSWYRRAAENGNPDAQRVLGMKYLRGSGVDPNAPEGLRWLTAAAQAGDPGAMSNLAWAHATGTGVERNDAIARDWYQRAADRGLSRAMVALALFHETGRGGPQDLRQAISYYTEALRRGESAAVVRLGLLAARGQIDDLVAPQTAAPWVAAAAQSGEAMALAWLETQSEKDVYQAQARLADLYLSQSARIEDAVALLRQAARSGDTFGQYRLGQLYAEGDVIDQDYIQAHKWFNIAATHGLIDAAEMREVISQLMTSDQIAEAQSLARVFYEEEGAVASGAASE